LARFWAAAGAATAATAKRASPALDRDFMSSLPPRGASRVKTKDSGFVDRSI
jgi:hypothetical protein